MRGWAVAAAILSVAALVLGVVILARVAGPEKDIRQTTPDGEGAPTAAALALPEAPAVAAQPVSLVPLGEGGVPEAGPNGGPGGLAALSCCEFP